MNLNDDLVFVRKPTSTPEPDGYFYSGLSGRGLEGRATVQQLKLLHGCGIQTKKCVVADTVGYLIPGWALTIVRAPIRKSLRRRALRRGVKDEAFRHALEAAAAIEMTKPFLKAQLAND